jgi:hypothetical protein
MTLTVEEQGLVIECDGLTRESGVRGTGLVRLHDGGVHVLIHLMLDIGGEYCLTVTPLSVQKMPWMQNNHC